MTTNIETRLIEPNKGQIAGLPKNPRVIRKPAFEKLKQSIKDLPEMLELRELIVYPYNGKYVTIGGNMRLKACIALGIEEIPCKILDKDTPEKTLREIAIKDNVAAGDDDWDLLANEWDSEELMEWGLFVPNFDEDDDQDEKDKEFYLQIKCEDEEQQKAFLNELKLQGFKVKSVNK
jgi:ParB-like chromosome segregation protein Spo0J